MKKELMRFGGEGGTVVHPAVMALVAVAILLIFIVPRRHVLSVVLPVFLLIPFSQIILVAGFHLMMLRVVLIFAWLRVIVRSEGTGSRHKLNRIDRALLLWGVFGTVTFTLLWMDVNAFFNRVGLFATTLGSYFLLRALIRDRADVKVAVRALVLISAVIAVAMFVESRTGNNLFSQWTEVRNGEFRAEGPFAHSLLAGAFGGTMLPICFWLWTGTGRSRLLALVGIISSTTIVLSSHTSTSILAYAAGLIALCCWSLREHMRAVRRGILAILVALQLVMKAPVWALIERIDLTGGSSSYHRYLLVDQFIRRFFDWWLLGVKTTNDWGWDLWDTSNYYVETGTTGGLIAFVAFLAILWRGFAAIGRYRRSLDISSGQQWGVWCLGCALFAHMVCFMGVSYFDQTIVALLALLAMIASGQDQLDNASEKAVPQGSNTLNWKNHKVVLETCSAGTMLR